MPDTDQHQHAYNLAAERKNGAEAPAAETGENEEGGSAAADSHSVTSGQWLLMFTGVGIFWLIGLATNLILPAIINVVMNYMVVGCLWLWAKTKNLHPPTFGTVTKGAAGMALKAAGPEGQAAARVASAADQVPGSDILYVALGGITPMLYLAALWYNNR